MLSHTYNNPFSVDELWDAISKSHDSAVGPDDEAFCATCYTLLTVNQILIECPQFNHLRQHYHFGSTLKDLFNNTSVNDIA